MPSRTNIVFSASSIALVACSWITLLSTAAAQGKWTVEYGAEIVKQVRSIEFPGDSFEMTHNFATGMALLKSSGGDKPAQLIAVDLRALRVVAQKEVPEDWNWETTTVGDKFACCVDANVLKVLDIATCTVIGQRPVPRTDALRILFDKAVWLSPGYWYALPTLKEVTEHAIVHPVAKARARLGLATTPPIQRSENSCFIDGVEYDSGFRTKNNFIGHAKDWNALPANESRYIAAIVKASPDDPKSTELSLGIPLAPLSIQTADQRNVLSANNPNRQGLEPSRDIPVHRYSQGLFVVVPNNVIVVQFNKQYQPMLDGVVLDYQPPLLKPDGEVYSGSVSSYNGTEIRTLYFSHGAWQVDTQLSEDKKSFTAHLLPRREPVTFDDGKPLEDVVNQIAGLAELDGDAGWEQIEEAYKKNNLYWLVPYAQGLKQKFDGVPVEVEVQTAQGSGSIVIDFPPQMLKDAYARIESRKRPAASVASLNDGAVGAAFSARLSAYAQRPKEYALPTPKLLPPLPQLTLPPAPDLSLIKAKLDTFTILAVTLWPLTILFRGLLLFGGLRFCNRHASPAESIEFIGGLWGILFVAAAWTLTVQGAALCIDWATDDFVLASGGLLVLRGTAKVLLDLGILWVVATIAARRTAMEMLPLTLSIACIMLLALLRTLPTMYRVMNG